MTTRFKLGQRVLVHQSPGLSIGEGAVLTPEPHDCSDPKQHWESRVIGWNEYQGLPTIATRVHDNPCHAEWTYTPESLTLLEGDDWADSSKYKVGDEMRFVWENKSDLHYKNGTILDARIETAHIQPGDWYVSFHVPSRGSPHGDWRFKIVVNEKTSCRCSLWDEAPGLYVLRWD